MGVILDWLFPKHCVECGKIGKYICFNCLKKVRINQIDGNRLGVFKYNGAIRKIIRLIKFELVTEAIDELADLTTITLKKEFPNLVGYWQKKKMTIIPVPLYWQRENWRGFNQSELLAKKIGEGLKLKIYTDSLIRIKKGKIQSLLSKREKETNLKNAFRVVSKLPKNIIIFDDVLTSGKTMAEIIKVLPANKNIFRLTIASGR
jgi:ComF family protein